VNTYLSKFNSLVGDTQPTALIPSRGSVVLPTDANTFLLGVLAAIVGGVVCKEHRLLGVIGGLAAGNGVGLLMAGKKNSAARIAVPALLGVYGSLKWKEHPILGYALPSLATGAVLNATLPSDK